MRYFASQTQWDRPLMTQTLNEPFLMELMVPLPLCAAQRSLSLDKHSAETTLSLFIPSSSRNILTSCQINAAIKKCSKLFKLVGGRAICPNCVLKTLELIVWHLRLHQTHCLTWFLPHPSAWIPQIWPWILAELWLRLSWAKNLVYSFLSLFSLQNNLKINPQSGWNVSAPPRTRIFLTGWSECLVCLVSGFASYFCPDYENLISYTSIMGSRSLKVLLNLFLQANIPR